MVWGALCGTPPQEPISPLLGLAGLLPLIFFDKLPWAGLECVCHPSKGQAMLMLLNLSRCALHLLLVSVRDEGPDEQVEQTHVNLGDFCGWSTGCVHQRLR